MNTDFYIQISALWGVISRLRGIIFSFAVGMNTGCLTASSYADGENSSDKL